MQVITARSFSQSFARCSEKQQEQEVETEDNGAEGEPGEELHPMVDRTKVIPVETSIKYLQSDGTILELSQRLNTILIAGIE